MATVSTDDAPRLLRFVYLGPQSMRWPAASIPAYGTFFALACTGIGVSFWTRPNLLIWLFMEVPASVVFALLATRTIFRFVDAERGLSYQRRTLMAELRAPRPTGQPTTFVTTIPDRLFFDHREGR